MRQGDDTFGIRDFVFEPSRKPVNSRKNFGRKDIIGADQHHEGIVTTEDIVKMLLVQFYLIPIIEPLVIAAGHGKVR